MSKVESKQGNVTLPSYVWNDLDNDYKDQRLNSRSQLILRYCKEGKARDDTLSLHLQVANAKDAISIKLDSILASRNCSSSESLHTKFDLAMALNASYGSSSGLQHTKASYQIAVFELFEELKQVDIDEYKIIKSILLKYNPLKNKYREYCHILSGQTTF